MTVGHPLIHLAYAYELDSPETASEGLSLLCTDFWELHDLIQNAPPDSAKYKTHSLADVLEGIRLDARFDNLFDSIGVLNVDDLMKKQPDAVLEHWNAWVVDNPVQQLEHICDVATILTMSSVDSKADSKFDFFILHLMTAAHALRVTWDIFPEDRKVPMLREWALMAITTYIAQFRFPFDMGLIEKVEIGGRDWEWVRKTALDHPAARSDVHFLKAVRAPRAFEQTFGYKNGFYLKAALKFLDTFRGWTGFGDFAERTGTGYDPSHEGWNAEDS